MIKRFLSTTMALAICMASTATVFAADIETSGGTGSADAVLTAEALAFKVTVPVALPINVDAAGIVTVATEAKIVNESAAPILVSDVVFTPVTGWTAIKFGKDMSLVKVGTKEIGFTINECATDDAGVLTFDQVKFPSIAASVGGTHGELPLVYNGTLAAQKTAIAGETVAAVVFTVGWDTII